MLNIKKLKEAEKTTLLCSALLLVGRILMICFDCPALFDLFIVGIFSRWMFFYKGLQFYYIGAVLLPISVAILWSFFSAYGNKSLVLLQIVGIVEVINQSLTFLLLSIVFLIGPSDGEKMKSPILIVFPLICIFLAKELVGSANDVLKERSLTHNKI